ncbi:MAG: hypothetical protein U0231_17235 [Nitrospiraceae bacterium]
MAQMADADVLVAEAILSYEHKRYPAIALLTKATELDPNNAQALYYHSSLPSGAGDAARAVAPLVTLHAQRLRTWKSPSAGAAYFDQKSRRADRRSTWKGIGGGSSRSRKPRLLRGRSSISTKGL